MEIVSLRGYLHFFCEESLLCDDGEYIDAYSTEGFMDVCLALIGSRYLYLHLVLSLNKNI